MDERTAYYAIELNISEDEDEYKVLNELEQHLLANGYHFYFSHDPYLNEVVTLLISEDETGYIDTILQDRNIEYKYI